MIWIKSRQACALYNTPLPLGGLCMFIMRTHGNVNCFAILPFYAQSVGIKLASPQAARLSMYIFLIGKSVALHLHEGPDLRNTNDRIEKRRKKSSIQPDLNPRPLCHEACPLLLCCNRCHNSISNFCPLLADNGEIRYSVESSEAIYRWRRILDEFRLLGRNKSSENQSMYDGVSPTRCTMVKEMSLSLRSF